MILAFVTVIQCEDCDRTAVLKDLAEHEAFEEKWHDGLRYHFCPTCRVKPQAEDRIEEDRAADTETARIARQIRKEYVH